MGFRRRAGGGKRDAAEPAIVDALRAVGAIVRHVGGTGNPDLLVRYCRRWTPMEVKTGKGKKTAAQVQEQTAGVLWPIVTTPEEALRAIGAII